MSAFHESRGPALVIAILVSQARLPAFRRTIDDRGWSHKTLKTKPYNNDILALPTNFDPENDHSSVIEATLKKASESADGPETLPYSIAALPQVFFTTKSRPSSTPSAILAKAFASFLTQNPTFSHVQPDLPKSYTIHGVLLLFPPSSFASPPWPDLSTLTPFFALLPTLLPITHVALNAPIPLSLDPSSSSNSSPPTATISSSDPNTLRSPTRLTPLWGDFGPAPLPASHIPSAQDLDRAFWTSTVQNGITQVWAPRYTMFSAGNIKEKTRLLRSGNVGRAVARGKEEGSGCAAVDLYVGIGYFAFSYLKAGVDVVVGWDLNAWSVEGARRGAERNGWVTERGEGVVGGELGQGIRLLVFCGDNRRAEQDLRGLKNLPPVRHVNLGLLPSSKGGWEVAVDVLDRTRGGWLHVHENFGVAEIEEKAEAARYDLEGIVRRTGGWHAETTVRLEEVFRVKSYAPGVWHCVVDIHIDPQGPSN